MFSAVQGGGSGNAGLFTATTWTGNATPRSITTNVDLSTYGGLVWVKDRSIASDHTFMDTVRGIDSALITRRGKGTELTGYTTKFTAFNTDGFSIGSADEFNKSGDSFVAWSFRKQSKFMDIQSWSGNDAGQKTITHSLGVTPGFILTFVRAPFASNSGFSTAWHRLLPIGGTDNGAAITFMLNEPSAYSSYYSSVTSTSFKTYLNTGGFSYISYIFGHDTATNGAVQCGEYTGNGSATGPSVSLGWNPQFLLIKNRTGTGHWMVIDAARGLAVGTTATLQESTAAGDVSALAPAEYSTNYVNPTGAGFQVVTTDANFNTNGDTYVYMAIRA